MSKEAEQPSAEELLLNAIADEDFPAKVVEEEQEVELSEEEVELREEASKMGWVDLDQYKGDKKRWVDAKEFIGRKDLYDKIHAQGKANEHLKQKLDAITKYVKQLTESDYRNKLAEARAKRDLAMDNDDREAADKANEEIAQLQVAREDEVFEDEEPDKTAQEELVQQNAKAAGEWIAQNPWFEADADLKELADDYAEAFSVNPANKNATVQDLFAYVDKKMARRVKAWEVAQEQEEDELEVEDEPEKEEKMSKVTAAPRSTRRSAQQRAPKYSRKDLDKTQLSTLVGWILPNQIMTEAEYIQSLVDNGDISK
jgi:hypothetical protein